MLLAEPKFFKDAINAIKKGIEYMPIDIKKLEGENIILWMNRKWHSLWLLILKISD